MRSIGYQFGLQALLLLLLGWSTSLLAANPGRQSLMLPTVNLGGLDNEAGIFGEEAKHFLRSGGEYTFPSAASLSPQQATLAALQADPKLLQGLFRRWGITRVFALELRADNNGLFAVLTILSAPDGRIVSRAKALETNTLIFFLENSIKNLCFRATAPDVLGVRIGLEPLPAEKLSQLHSYGQVAAKSMIASVSNSAYPLIIFTPVSGIHRSAESQSSPSALANVGSVYINSTPSAGAEVQIDKLGTFLLPYSDHLVPVGSYRFTIAKPGYIDYTSNMEIKTSFHTEVGMILKANIAGVVISSIPAGAEITIGNIYYGMTPIVFVSPPGEYRISLTYKGFINEMLQLNIKPGDMRMTTIKMKKDPEYASDMVFIPAGEFVMGQDAEKQSEVYRHQVYLNAFYIEKYEVTNAQYDIFLQATGHAPPPFWQQQRWNSSSQPVVGVNWHDAQAYAKWRGRRLPTEAEWEKAARGSSGLSYPWGNEQPTANHANYASHNEATVSVGKYRQGQSPYGVFDMSGNVSEWCADIYQQQYYAFSPYENPTGPRKGTKRVVRGGSYFNSSTAITTYYRFAEEQGLRDTTLGFRCVLDAELE